MTDRDLWPNVLTELSHRRGLGPDQATAAMTAMMEGDATEAQIGAFLLGLRTKGETVEEMEAFAAAMLSFAVPVRAPEPVIDTCGTGGDGAGTFNISTVAALVVAGAGVPVAKHGNRAATSPCGPVVPGRQTAHPGGGEPLRLGRSPGGARDQHRAGRRRRRALPRRGRD